ncbi:hypothetical protein GCM10010187_13250 [Actinomadura coerulea]|nr:hypothetical protein GCM10010187_13250 [Actinomadura coerulea]
MAEGREELPIESGHGGKRVVEDGHTVRDDAVTSADPTAGAGARSVLAGPGALLAARDVRW